MGKLSTLYLNQYAQDVIGFKTLYERYTSLTNSEKNYIKEVLIDLILQSDCRVEDIGVAISYSQIKSTRNCCVVARKGIYYHNLKKVLSVDCEELVIHFLASLFRVGYIRKRKEQKVGKWWYEDLYTYNR